MTFPGLRGPRGGEGHVGRDDDEGADEGHEHHQGPSAVAPSPSPTPLMECGLLR